MQISIEHNNIALLMIIDDYDCIPEQKETGPTYSSGGDPGFPEMIEINSCHLELENNVVNSKLTNMINKQLLESNTFCDHILNLYFDIIEEKILTEGA